MTPPIFVLFELAVASLLAAATARFNLQVVGANLPTCNKDELQATVKQTTGFALVASAFTLHTDNFLAGTAHGVYVGLVVSGIMTLVLLWEALPEILSRVCRTIDASAESLAASVESALNGVDLSSSLRTVLSVPGQWQGLRQPVGLLTQPLPQLQRQPQTRPQVQSQAQMHSQQRSEALTLIHQKIARASISLVEFLAGCHRKVLEITPVAVLRQSSCSELRKPTPESEDERDRKD